MFKNRFLARAMTGVAAVGAALLMMTPSASAFDHDFFEDKKFGKDSDCFVTGVVATSNLLNVDILDILEITLLPQAVAYVNLSCSTPRGSSAFATIFIEGEVIPVALELVYPTFASSLGHGHGFDHKKFDHGGKFQPKKVQQHFVYEGVAPITNGDLIDIITTNGTGTVPVRANGTSGTLQIIEANLEIELLGGDNDL